MQDASITYCTSKQRKERRQCVYSSHFQTSVILAFLILSSVKSVSSIQLSPFELQRIPSLQVSSFCHHSPFEWIPSLQLSLFFLQPSSQSFISPRLLSFSHDPQHIILQVWRWINIKELKKWRKRLKAGRSQKLC